MPRSSSPTVFITSCVCVPRSGVAAGSCQPARRHLQHHPVRLAMQDPQRGAMPCGWVVCWLGLLTSPRAAVVLRLQLLAPAPCFKSGTRIIFPTCSNLLAPPAASPCQRASHNCFCMIRYTGPGAIPNLMPQPPRRTHMHCCRPHTCAHPRLQVNEMQ